MKAPLLLVTLLWGSLAFAADNALVTCKFEGQDFEKHLAKASGFPHNAIAGEYALMEELNDSTEITGLPSRLKVKVNYYVKENGKIVRKGLPGRPLERIGYSVLGETVTFSYMSFSYADQPDFQISTDGATSIITYSQTGWAQRDYYNSLNCEVHKMAQIEGPELNVENMTDQELVNLLLALRYRRQTEARNVSPEEFTAAMNAVEERLNNLDFTQDSIEIDKVEWVSSKKCGGLKIDNYSYTSPKAILDHRGNVVGYYLHQVKCKGKVNLVKYRWNPDTGERYERVEERTPAASGLYFDKNLRLLNLDSEKNKVQFQFGY